MPAPTVAAITISPLTLTASLGSPWVWAVTLSASSRVFELGRDYAIDSDTNSIIRLEDGRITADRATVIRHGENLATSQGFFFEQNLATFDEAIDLNTAQLEDPSPIVYQDGRDYRTDERDGVITLLSTSRVIPEESLEATFTAFDPLNCFATPGDFEQAYGVEEAIALSRPDRPNAAFPAYSIIEFWLTVASSECRAYLHTPLEDSAELTAFLKGKVCELTRQYLENGRDRPISKHRDEITRRQFEAIAARATNAADNVEFIDTEGDTTARPIVSRAGIRSLSREGIARWL